eukprot:maker-scaffold712_size108441-snap-gene-0.33 protein:Tk06087 transcript:maker-scaffold712_size108441-snap-gene-0.33-mRNA-1 annotation:"set and mynd domain-containing"
MSGQEGFTDKIKSFFGSKESLAEFEGLSTNADRIQFLYRHPFVQTLFKTQVGEAKERGRPHGKSDCEAKRQRELGNQAFKSGNDKKALQFYNEAIIFANGNPAIITSPSSNKQSLEFAYSAANRSAALFRLARYQEALRDVDSALKANHPKPEKLWERKLRCLTELGPCSPDEMEATWSEAEANLKTDTLQALKKQIDLQSVHKCPPELLRGPARNFTEGKPSVDPAEIIRGDALEYANLSLRAVSQKPLDFFLEHGPKWLDGDHETFGTQTSTDVFLPGDYQSMASLVKHQASRTPAKHFWILVTACLNLRQLQMAGYFRIKAGQAMEEPGPRFDPPLTTKLTPDMKLIGTLLVHFLELLQFNTHSVVETCFAAVPPSTEWIQLNLFPSRQSYSLGVGIFPTFALLNHSCGPNVFKCFTGNQVVVMASQNIRKGEEVCENYHPHHHFMDKAYRSAWLKEHYNFLCACQACENDWPTLKTLMHEPHWHFPKTAKSRKTDKWDKEVKEVEEAMEHVGQVFRRLQTTDQALEDDMEATLAQISHNFHRLDRFVRGYELTYSWPKGEEDTPAHLSAKV